MEECQDPNGLSRLYWKTGNKRKDGDSNMPEANQKQRKRRKLQYLTLPKVWGFERMSERWIKKRRTGSFIMDGFDSKVGMNTGTGQLHSYSAENES